MGKIDYYIKEFELENDRCNHYFDLMYRIIQFSFVAIVALFGISFQIENNPIYVFLLFSYFIPATIYVFGTLYAHNAYSLAVCGERAEILHKFIYDIVDECGEDEKEILSKYVVGKRIVSLFTYGVALFFYLFCPIAGLFVGYILSDIKADFIKTNIILMDKIIYYLPMMFSVFYYLIMIIVIINIGKKHFKVNN